MTQRATRDALRLLIDTVDAILFDGDGVLWLSNDVIPGATQLVDKLESMGKQVVLVTNNSTKSRKGYAFKSEKLGFHTFARNDGALSVTTSAVVADYLKTQKFEDKVYLIGTTGVTDELDLAGIRYECDWDKLDMAHSSNSIDVAEVAKKAIGNDHEVRAVIVAFDPYFNYSKICKASYYINNRENCQYLATNCDDTFPSPDKSLVPGTGCLVAAVSAAVGRLPQFVGKPEKPIYDYVIRNCIKSDIPPERILMIGDRLQTDILFANNNGLKSLCVLTGCTDEKLLNETHDKNLLPTYFANSVDDILQALL